jgi:hypothetical protein
MLTDELDRKTVCYYIVLRVGTSDVTPTKFLLLTVLTGSI